jgi:hypothetical protein
VQLDAAMSARRPTIPEAGDDYECPFSHDCEKVLRRLMSDNELRAEFWRAGYQVMAEVFAQQAARWIGSRLLGAAGGALLAFAVWIALRFGGIAS